MLETAGGRRMLVYGISWHVGDSCRAARTCVERRGGWADEIVSFGFIIAIIAVLMVMSRLGKRKRLREKDKDRE